MNVEGCTALVTGANRGIGKAILEGLIAAGASKVYAAVRDPSSAGALLEAHEGIVSVLALDVSNSEAVQSAARTASDVSLVVNNAGVLVKCGVCDPAAFDSLAYEMNVNVIGLLRMAHAFAPILKANGGGAFVQLNSIASLKSFGDFATYSASKAAAYSLTQALREDLAAQGTHVVSIHPGPIATDMAQNAGLSEIAEPPEVVAKAMISALKERKSHCFPDSMAGEFESAYRPFLEKVIG